MLLDASRKSYELESTVESFYTGGTTQLSPSGEEIYCTCGDAVNVLDTATGERVHQVKDDGSDISSFAISPDGKTLITSCKALLMHQFNLSDKTFSKRWKHQHRTQVLTMAFDSTSTLLASGSSDNTIKVYDVIKMYYTHNFKGSEGSISVLKFLRKKDSLTLFSAADDGKIRMWDLQANKCVSVLDGHFSPVTSLAFTQDSKTLISAARDKVVVFWDITARKPTRTVPVFEVVECVQVVQREKCVLQSKETLTEEEYVLTAGEHGKLRLWSLSGGSCVYTQNDAPAESNVVQLHCHDNNVVAVTEDHNIVVYDAQHFQPKSKLVGHYDEMLDLRFFGAEEEYVAMATNSAKINIMKRGAFSSQILVGHTDIVLSIDVSFDGKYIASSSKDNTIRVWGLNENKEFCCLATGSGHTHSVGTVTWPCLSTDYLVSGSHDLTIKCWKLPNMLMQTECVALTVKWTEKAHEKDINVVCASPNDKLVVSGSQDKTAKVWKLKSGKLLGTMRGHKRGVWCARFSPVDQCVVTGSADSTVKLWLLSDFTCIKTFEGHNNSVLRVEFLLRGMQLISSGSEGLVKVWNIQTNECVNTLEAHEDKIWCLTKNKSEDVVLTGAGDSSMKVWKDVTEKLILEDEEKLNQKLANEQELSNLLQEKKYIKAVRLAITLDRPFRVLNIFKDVTMNSDISIEDITSELDDTLLNGLLGFITHWNTNAKHSEVAQKVLSVILKQKSASELLEFPNIKEVVESLLPYTERHYDRTKLLVQQSMFVTYTWESMKLSSDTIDR